MMIRRTMVLVALCVASQANAQNLDFLITNATGRTITKIEVQPTGQTDWAENRLKHDKLADTKRSSVFFPRADDQCKYDVRAEFSSGDPLIWRGIDFCDNAYLTLRIKNGQPEYSVD
ncbi:hypothetical protein [Stakelama marina]|uniref:Uncharacterized protein n=1 Tax=Stakelama marina TaxID=2826939 RepID=A0A8T4IH94_9SPHN|nr:hypothetical protein [Stakelama marina]MBR0553871.1 hypothetical protein [Stakelama marina]